MVECSNKLNQTFRALSHPTRRAMLEDLRNGPETIGALAEAFEISFAATSRHLGILEDARFIRRKKQGRKRLCHLEPDAMQEAKAWLEQHAAFWNSALGALETALKEEGNANG